MKGCLHEKTKAREIPTSVRDSITVQLINTALAWHLPVKANASPEIPLAGGKSTFFYKNPVRATYQSNILFDLSKDSSINFLLFK